MGPHRDPQYSDEGNGFLSGDRLKAAQATEPFHCSIIVTRSSTEPPQVCLRVLYLHAQLTARLPWKAWVGFGSQLHYSSLASGSTLGLSGLLRRISLSMFIIKS
mmetsp:Transcript_10295/g.37944  ORF Transcript_10295/g.37944 Transcript_10295/m.37944 type:complete len:104 (+) Transcript_10295:120-431(+)